MKCVKTIDVDSFQCASKCEGMDIISYNEYAVNYQIKPKLTRYITQLSNYYNKYKESYNITKFPSSLKCKYYYFIS